MMIDKAARRRMVANQSRNWLEDCMQALRRDIQEGVHPIGASIMVATIRAHLDRQRRRRLH